MQNLTHVIELNNIYKYNNVSSPSRIYLKSEKLIQYLERDQLHLPQISSVL